MKKYTEEEECEVKWKLRTYQKRANQLREKLKTEVLDEEERKKLSIILQTIEKRIHRINSNIIPNAVVTPETKKSQRTKSTKGQRRRIKHTWRTTTMRIFGSEQKKKPHRRVNMGMGGEGKYDGSSSSSVRVIYTPIGGKCKR